MMKRPVNYVAGLLGKRAGTAAYKAAIRPAGTIIGQAGVGTASARLAAARSARAAVIESKKPLAKKLVYGGTAAGIMGATTAMRPNANQSRTSYRGPMQTGRGSGRYA